jgi:putative flavoprotein involved in K+ transport
MRRGERLARFTGIRTAGVRMSSPLPAEMPLVDSGGAITPPACRTADVVVIGAGPAGLGISALLAADGFEALILERGPGVATKWRTRYDRLQTNTSSLFSYLPGFHFARDAGRWVGRDDLIAYYEGYAARHGLRACTGVEATRIDRAGSGWRVETSRGPLLTRAVIVATGKQNLPVLPNWPGRDDFGGELIHSADYRNASAYRGRRALVVGAGNSGVDIALDLLEGRAEQVWLSVRRPPHMVIRETFGMPHDVLAVLSRRLPRRLVDANAKLIRRLSVGDLSDLGLPIPDDGPVARLEREGKVPTVDTGAFVSAIRAQRLKVVAAVSELEPTAVVLADGARVEPDLVVAATGYRPNLEPLVGHLDLIDARGLPLACGATAHPSAPALHFIGFEDPRSGHLREIRLEARGIAGALRRQLGRSSPRSPVVTGSRNGAADAAIAP